MTANNLNNQPESLDDQIAAFEASIEAIKAKKLAIVSSLESEYAATIAHCKQTMDTMIKAGLDPRTLARDITALYAPSVTTTRATTTRTTATDGTKVNRKLNRPGPHTKGGKNWAICDDILQQNYGDLSKVTGAEVAVAQVEGDHVGRCTPLFGLAVEQHGAIDLAVAVELVGALQ